MYTDLKDNNTARKKGAYSIHFQCVFVLPSNMLSIKMVGNFAS